MRSMKKHLLIFLSFGLVAAGIFPFYANLFVEWKPGMLVYFVIGCVFAGFFVGVGNFFVFRKILLSLKKVVAAESIKALETDFSEYTQTDDLFDSFRQQLLLLINELVANRELLRESGRGLAAGLNEILEVISLAEEMTRLVSDESGKTIEQAQHGKNIIKDTIKTCKTTQQSIDLTLQNMDTFEKSFTEIEKAFQTINKVSRETRLVATNASIIAGRAGLEGKSFAVVAEEVRRLALDIKDTTEIITGTIDETRGHAQNAVHVITQTANGFDNQAQAFYKAEQYLNNISEAIEKNIEDMEKIISRINTLTDIKDKIVVNSDTFTSF